MISSNDLKKQVLLEDMEAPEIERLARILEEKALKKGEPLFNEGDETKGIYMINSGKIEISKLTPDGWKQTLAVLSIGNFFGELSILEKRKHEASATAIENTSLYKLSRDAFEKLEKEDSALAFQIIKKIAITMSKNLRRMNEKFLNALINY